MDRNRKISIMGIVNLTEDSYFAQSRCTDVDAALVRISSMLEEGADIIDIGACSSRPGSVQIGADAEWERIEPVLKAVKETFPHVALSIDTVWASVVRRSHALVGEFMVNDISAGEDDPDMLPTVGSLSLPYVAMHKRGNPADMQHLASYDDVVEDVFDYFMDFSSRAESCGISGWILDPGFGFAKTVEQNYQLLSGISRFKDIKDNDGEAVRILVGISRKSMIYRYLDIAPEDALPATQVLHLAALQGGADILRVHDVAEAVRTLKLYRALA